MEILAHPGPYTEADLPDENPLVELLEGTLIVNPQPTPLHQLVVIRVRDMIEVPAGYEALPDIGVRVPGGSYFIPDIGVVPVEMITNIPTTFEPADVRLVVEIVSPSSETADRVIKPRLYAQAGIEEFWLVETGERLANTVVHVHRLSEGVYVEERSFRLQP